MLECRHDGVSVLFSAADLLLCSHMVEGGTGPPWGFFYKSTNLIHEGFTLMI